MVSDKFELRRSILLYTFVCIISMYFLGLFFFNPGGKGIVLFTDTMSVLGVLAAILLLFLNFSSSSEKERKFWLLCIISFSCYVMGDLLWFWKEAVLMQEIPFPSIMDLLYLLSALFATIGIFYLIFKSKTRSNTLQIFLNIIFVMLLITIIAWPTMFAPIIEDSEASKIGIIISILYPMSDLIIIFGLISLFLINEKTSISFIRVAFGFAILAFADVMYTYMVNNETYQSGSLIDLLWPTSLMIVASASIKGDEENPNKLAFNRIDKAREIILGGKALLIIPSLIMLLFVAMMSKHYDSKVIFIGYCLANLLLIIRHYLSSKESNLLKKELSNVNAQLTKNKEMVSNHFEALKNNYASTVENNRKDYLTGAYNRRYVDEFKKDLNSENHCSVIVADVDCFKLVNDQFGHNVGDIVLTEIAAIMKKCARQGEVVGRYGGDEFVLILPGTKISEAVHVAERIRTNIFNHIIIVDTNKISCTVSIGLTEWEETDTSIDELIEKADKGLYIAKGKGKNRCEVYLYGENAKLEG